MLTIVDTQALIFSADEDCGNNITYTTRLRLLASPGSVWCESPVVTHINKIRKSS